MNEKNRCIKFIFYKKKLYNCAFCLCVKQEHFIKRRKHFVSSRIVDFIPTITLKRIIDLYLEFHVRLSLFGTQPIFFDVFGSILMPSSRTIVPRTRQWCPPKYLSTPIHKVLVEGWGKGKREPFSSSLIEIDFLWGYIRSYRTQQNTSCFSFSLYYFALWNIFQGYILSDEVMFLVERFIGQERQKNKFVTIRIMTKDQLYKDVFVLFWRKVFLDKENIKNTCLCI